MTCVFAFPELANRNAFIRDLEKQGYHVDFVGNYLVIYGLPYLDEHGALQHGHWASPLDLTTDGVIDPPSDHQAWFVGSRPYDGEGRQLRLGGGAGVVTISPMLRADQSFSFKLTGPDGVMRPYVSFEEKVTTYLDAITAPARAKFEAATPLRAIETKAAEQGTPLRYPDTMSSRYHLNDLAMRLDGKRVAIIGLGGAGSYILDFAARTHLAEIALFDDDKVHVHTIFRIPGFIPNAIGKEKVNALAQQYGLWHDNIRPFEERISAENIDKLEAYDFVFIAVDHGPSRIFIADWLSTKGIAFVDCGMGLNRVEGGLNGVVRITGGDRAVFDRTAGTMHLPGGDPEGGEYRKQAQIAELNALNAALAIIWFKQHFGIYARDELMHSMTFETTTFEAETLGVE